MSSSYCRLYVHLVWATKYRERWICGAIATRLHGLISVRCNELDCIAVAVGGVEDHVHLLVGLHPSVAVAQLTQAVKASSSAFMRKQDALRDFAWQEGYGAFSLRDTELGIVRLYVRDQPRHHAEGTFTLDWERTGPPKDA